MGRVGRGFWSMGVVMLALTVGLLLLALFQTGVASLALNITGLTLGLTGLIFAWVGRFLGRMDTADLLQSGQPATARVLAVRDTGLTVNHIYAALELTLEIHPPERPAYTVQTRTLLERTQWGTLQPGMVVQVRVDPQNPQRVAIESVTAGQASQYYIAGVQRVEDIVATGLQAEAEVLAVQATGASAAQLSPGLALRPDQADDPVMVVRLRVYPPKGAPFEAESALRIPDGKGHALVVGQRVPVAYLPDDPARTTTLHWAKVPTRS